MLKTTTERVEFIGSTGEKIAGKLDKPIGPIRTFALYAHCFTCTKEFIGSRSICEALASHGIAVLRFDFTGLGSSGGEFGETNFLSNVQDLIAASKFMEEDLEAPSMLIGHSLGGAAVLSAAKHIDSAKVVISIAAPADADHVIHNFADHVEEIETNGSAKVKLGGKELTIGKQFLDDLRAQKVTEGLSDVRKAFLIMHSPTDNMVGIENAGRIFAAAKHPKSFVSLDQADHLLTKPEDAAYVAANINTWASRYLPRPEDTTQKWEGHVKVSETGASKFQNWVQAGPHGFMADEPKSYGGTETGPTPYNLLAAALGACTNMTLRNYASLKNLEIGQINVEVEYSKIHMDDCSECEQSTGGKIDQFERRIEIKGLRDAELEEKLLSIADRCPVHKTLENQAHIVTSTKKKT
jgi:putative redox protein